MEEFQRSGVKSGGPCSSTVLDRSPSMYNSSSIHALTRGASMYRVNRTHLDIFLSSSQKNRNSLTWVLVALTVCFTYPVLYRVSAESRAGEWEL